MNLNYLHKTTTATKSARANAPAASLLFVNADKKFLISNFPFSITFLRFSIIFLVALANLLTANKGYASNTVLASNTQAAANRCAGTTNQVIHSVDISSTSGSTRTVTTLQNAMGGTWIAGDVSNFKLYYTNTTNTFATTTLLATITSPATGTQSFTGFTVTLAANQAHGYFWITADITSGAVNNHTFIPGAMGTGDFTSSNTNSGSSIAGNTQTIINPTNTAIGGGAAAVCVGLTTAAFTDATGGGTWSITNGTGSATITAGGVVTGSTAGTATVNYAVTSSGCTNTQTAALTVNAMPVVAAIGGGSTPVCNGSATSAFTDATGGGTWSTTSGTGSATITAGGVATGTSAGTVTINYAVTTSGCTTTQTAALTVNTCSTITLASNTISAACIAPSQLKAPIQSFSLAASVSNANLTDVGFTTTGSYAQADITKYQLWYSASNVLSGATQLGVDLASSGTAGARSFAAFTSPTLTSGTTYYFWITVDVSASATSTNTIASNAVATTDLTSTSTKAGGPTTAGGTQTITAVPAQPSIMNSN